MWDLDDDHRDEPLDDDEVADWSTSADIICTGGHVWTARSTVTVYTWHRSTSALTSLQISYQSHHRLFHSSLHVRYSSGGCQPSRRLSRHGQPTIIFFYRANSYASAVLAVVILSVRPSVCLPVCHTLSYLCNFYQHFIVATAFCQLANKRIYKRKNK